MFSYFAYKSVHIFDITAMSSFVFILWLHWTRGHIFNLHISFIIKGVPKVGDQCFFLLCQQMFKIMYHISEFLASALICEFCSIFFYSTLHIKNNIMNVLNFFINRQQTGHGIINICHIRLNLFILTFYLFVHWSE